ncbi:hypothetical protein RFI_08863, partial [Reticulomyxa filosa]
KKKKRRRRRRGRRRRRRRRRRRGRRRRKEEEAEEDCEPQVSYSRIGELVKTELKKDQVCFLSAHSRYLVLGMQSGQINICDTLGNIIKHYRPHKNAINDISIDVNGDFIASCAKDDGRVVIRDVFQDTDKVHSFHQEKHILTVSLHPNYSDNNNTFVCGGMNQQVLERTMGYFRSETNILHCGEGPIYCIRRRKDIIAWNNDRGIKLYDTSNRKPIAAVKRASERANPSDPFQNRCCLCWEDDDTLLIGWGDWVKIAKIKSVISVNGAVSKTVDICGTFIIDYYVCGIAPFGENLMLLGYLDNEEENDNDSF